MKVKFMKNRIQKFELRMNEVIKIREHRSYAHILRCKKESLKKNQFSRWFAPLPKEVNFVLQDLNLNDNSACYR